MNWDLLVEQRNECAKRILRLGEVSDSFDCVRSESAMTVLAHAEQDLHSALELSERTPAMFCWIVRNVDVSVSAVLEVNNMICGVSLKKSERALRTVFLDDFDVIQNFRTLRSFVLAHPTNTHYTDNDGNDIIVYLEDISGGTCDSSYDYVLTMCNTNRKPYYEHIVLSRDIFPVIEAIMHVVARLSDDVHVKILDAENVLANEPLVIDKSSDIAYIMSLDKELKKRYPSEVSDTPLSDGSIRHYSIVSDYAVCFEQNDAFVSTPEYIRFLDYLRAELTRIEHDLQAMEFDVDKYFGKLVPSFDIGHYECRKVSDLHDSNAITYHDGFIADESTVTYAEWAVVCLLRLLPTLNKYFVIDMHTSDKSLYCQYLAAVYFSNL